MSYIGKSPAVAALTASDITDGIISTAKIADDAVTAAKASFAPGKVLQVVTATDSTIRSSTSSSFVTASNTLSLNITPSSTSNKIYLNVSGGVRCGSAGTMYITIYRGGSTNLGDSDYGLAAHYDPDSDGTTPLSISVLDSPSSTSEQTYQVYFKRNNTNASASLRPTKNIITAFEILG